MFGKFKKRIIMFFLVAGCLIGSIDATFAYPAMIGNGKDEYPICESKDSLSEFTGALSSSDADTLTAMVNSHECYLTTDKIKVNVMDSSIFGGWAKVDILSATGWTPIEDTHRIVQQQNAASNDSKKPLSLSDIEG